MPLLPGFDLAIEQIVERLHNARHRKRSPGGCAAAESEAKNRLARKGADQGDISGLSRSVSNIGSSLGTALVGSVLVAAAAGYPFATAATILLVFALIGLVLSVLIPHHKGPDTGQAKSYSSADS